MNKFCSTTLTNLFVYFLGEFEDTKKSFRNYLNFMCSHYKLVCLDPLKLDILTFLFWLTNILWLPTYVQRSKPMMDATNNS